MLRKIVLFIAATAPLACVPTTEESLPNTVNPASSLCDRLGGALLIESSLDGSQMGMCSFGQGQSCEEWNLFRGNCNPGGRFFDAFTFCLAQGDGPVLDSAPPMGLAKLLTEQGILPADAAAEMLPNTRWRCMGGEVWVCPIGANLPCDEQADLSREPTAAMKEFCTTNFGANSIPSYVTGRATVYDWSCDGETAQPGAQRLTTDPMGFLAEFWYRVETPGML